MLGSNDLTIIEDGYVGTSYVNANLAPGNAYAYKVRSFSISDANPYAYGYSAFSRCSGAATMMPSLLSITVRPSGPRMTLPDTMQFTAYGNYSDGTVQDMTSAVTWNSSDETRALIDNEGTQKYSDWLGALSHCAGQSCKDIENLPPPQ